jgi:hypothetical protein
LSRSIQKIATGGIDFSSVGKRTVACDRGGTRFAFQALIGVNVVRRGRAKISSGAGPDFLIQMFEGKK